MFENKYGQAPKGWKPRYIDECPIFSKKINKSDRVLCCRNCKNMFDSISLDEWVSLNSDWPACRSKTGFYYF